MKSLTRRWGRRSGRFTRRRAREGGRKNDATRRERAIDPGATVRSQSYLIAAADRGKHGSLSFPSSIFSTSAVMFLVLKMWLGSDDLLHMQRTSCLGTRPTVRGREEDERPAHTSRSRLDTNPEARPDDVTKKF